MTVFIRDQTYSDKLCIYKYIFCVVTQVTNHARNYVYLSHFIGRTRFILSHTKLSIAYYSL